MSEKVDHPDHYNRFPVECIEIAELMDFCTGNALKYLWRAGAKEGADILTDLRKARWYIDRKISLIERQRDGKIDSNIDA